MGKLKLLLVENSRTARILMSELLQQAGFDIIVAASGEEANSYLAKYKIDVVIMDVFMPLMNGYEISKLIRHSKTPYAQVPIIAYTASQQEQDKRLCLESGMNAVIHKSDDNSELIKWLDNFSGPAQ